MNKMEDIARHSSDFDEPESLGWTPVALRVRVRDLPLEVDELGKKDSFADAWFVGARIPSEDIEVWNGSRWVPVRSANSSEMLEAAQEAAEWESEDGEPYDEWGDNDGWFEPNFELFHP